MAKTGKHWSRYPEDKETAQHELASKKDTKRKGSYNHEGTVKQGHVSSIVETFGALKRKKR